MVREVVVKLWLPVGSQRTQVEVVGVSIEAVVLLKEGSVKVDLPSLLPVEDFPFQVMASQTLAQLLVLAVVVVLVVVLKLVVVIVLVVEGSGQ